MWSGAVGSSPDLSITSGEWPPHEIYFSGPYFINGPDTF